MNENVCAKNENFLSLMVDSLKSLKEKLSRAYNTNVGSLSRFNGNSEPDSKSTCAEKVLCISENLQELIKDLNELSAKLNTQSEDFSHIM